MTGDTDKKSKPAMSREEPEENWEQQLYGMTSPPLFVTTDELKARKKRKKAKRARRREAV